MKALIVFLALTLSFNLAIGSSNIVLDSQNPDGKWLTIKGAPTGSYLGRIVRNIGDFNGDGIDDMIVAAPNTTFDGTLYVIYGQKNGFSMDFISVNSTYPEGFLIRGPSNKNFSGFSVSKAIDLNGDGLCDIVIGTSTNSIVYVIYGQKGHTGDIMINQDFSFSSQGFAIFGIELTDFGFWVSSAGDFNGDGLDDLLIGAPLSLSSFGAVYLIYGKKEAFSNIYLNVSSSSNQWLFIRNMAYPGRMGASVDGVGDINGDGIDDILLGAPDTFRSQGMVYALYGRKKLSDNMITIDPSMSTGGFMINGSQAVPQRFGGIVSSAGDINGDGVGDFIIGGVYPQNRVTYPSSRAYILYGQKENWPDIVYADALQQGFLILDSQSTITSLGIVVSGGGDINGDGIDDILVRANNKPNGGYVAVIYGTSAILSGSVDISVLTADQGFVISGYELNMGGVFNSVSTGDLDNDHIDDVIIGCPQAGGQAGKAIIVFGSNGCSRYCSSCSSPSLCSTCFEGYGLYGGACGACPVGTFLSEGRCEECSDDCIQCKSRTKCQICEEGYTLSEAQTCISESQKTQAAISTGLFDGASAISNTLAIGSSVPTSFGLVAKIVRNTKYLNISVSKDLQMTFNSWRISTGIFPAPEDSSDSEGVLPLMFERYGIKKAFLINYWKSFMMILIGLGVFMICKCAETIFPKNSSVKNLTRTVNVAASNFALTQFYGNIDDVLFYFVLDIRSSESASSSLRIFGFILGLAFLVLGLLVTGLHGAILFQYQRLKKKQGGARDAAQADFFSQFLRRYENMKLFYQDFKDIDVFQQAFLLINITRSLLSSFIFTMLFHYPLLQILLLIALNVSILAYLLMKKPFKDRANAYAQYYCEGILSLAYLSVLVLAFMDEADSEASSSIKGFSLIVIISNMALLIGSAVFMLVNIAIILYKMYQERKSSETKKEPIAIRSRLEYSKKIDSSQNDVTVANSLNNSEKSHIITDVNLNNSGLVVFNEPKEGNLVHSSVVPSDPFKTDTSPVSFANRRTFKVKYQKRDKPPIIKSSLAENHPEVSIQQSFNTFRMGDSSLLCLNSQSNLLLNPIEIKEESTFNVITTQNNDIILRTFQDEARTENIRKQVPLEAFNGEDVNIPNEAGEKRNRKMYRRKIKKDKKISSD